MDPVSCFICVYMYICMDTAYDCTCKCVQPTDKLQARSLVQSQEKEREAFRHAVLKEWRVLFKQAATKSLEQLQSDHRPSSLNFLKIALGFCFVFIYSRGSGEGLGYVFSVACSYTRTEGKKMESFLLRSTTASVSLTLRTSKSALQLLRSTQFATNNVSIREKCLFVFNGYNVDVLHEVGFNHFDETTFLYHQ